MKRIFIRICAISFLVSCNNQGDQKASEKKDTLNKDTAAFTTLIDTSSRKIANPDEFPVDFTPTRTFTADKADLHEVLRVQQLNDKKIAYEASMENGECEKIEFRGVAVLKEGDAESDSDEKDNGYFVAEYVQDRSKTCAVFIRIGADKGYTNRARFIIADCPGACKNKSESETLFLSK